MTTAITGGCLCGALRYAVSGQPVTHLVCHCTHCQKQTGSAFSTVFGVLEDQITMMRGGTRSYQDCGKSGRMVERHFCGTCGAPLFSKAEAAPGMLLVKAGSLDEAQIFVPAMHIWTRSKQAWVDTGGLPNFAANPS